MADTPLDTDVLIVGTSLSGMMTALNLRHRNADLSVTLLGPEPHEEKRPLVGESLVEPGILFFREVGLGAHLDEHQALKNGLIFYHKLDLDNPKDRAYSVHAPKILHHKARQMRRLEFDQACHARVRELGATVLHGVAEQVEIGRGGAHHRVTARVDGQPRDIRARWIVDTTGRKRLIGTRVTTYERPAEQRCTFWFRLRQFEPFSDHIDAQLRRPLEYDPWLTTHHFLGRGYWMWVIPLQTGPDNLCSIGFTYRPDVFGKERIRSVDDVLAYADRDHPAMAEMIRSGQIVDTQMYFDYFYTSKQIYSEDGWFLVGDTARTVDPLYSNGISMTTLQVGQIATIIERQRAGTLLPGDVEALDVVGRRMMERSQREVTEQYPIMHDPFQACMRRYLNVTGWFNLFLPLWWNGCFTTPEGARFLERLFKPREPDVESLWTLAAEASAVMGPPYQHASFDAGPDIDNILNLRFDCPRDQLMATIGLGFTRRSLIRRKLLALNGYRRLFRELPALVREATRPLLLRLVPLFHPRLLPALDPPLPGLYRTLSGPRPPR